MSKTTEIYSKGELKAKAEVALMTGYVTPIRDKDNIIFMLDYIANVIDEGHKYMTGEEIYNEAVKYVDLKKTMIIGLSVCRILGGTMPCVNVIFKDIKDAKFHLDDEYGVLTHVHNFAGPDLSELGYCFFEKVGKNNYHRIS